MPIRLVDDDPEEYQPQDNNNNNNDNSGGGGGGNFGGFGNIIGMLLPLLFRYPKLLIVVAIGFGIYYFAGNGCGGGQHSSSSALSTGMEMKQSVFDKAKVFEPLSAGTTELPAAVSLQAFCPSRLNQGRQGSCVGWASAYAARTILQAQATGADPNTTAFSPAYVYNQIHLDNCQGSYMVKALETLSQQGLLPLSQFPYDDNDCDNVPNATQRQNASQYKLNGFTRLTEGGDSYGIDVQGMKQNLAQGAPVLIGAMVTESFQYLRGKRAVWHPTSNDRVLGGHALCVMGYDDKLEGGAFQIMNSWGEDWGDRGFGWVRYSDFKSFCKEAYGLHPLTQQATSGKFDVKIGLIENTSKNYIPLTLKSPNLFSSQPIAKNTRFKVEVTNQIACYTYVFGQETDNSSYTLFPYPKYSAFCGITGTRRFPKDKSLAPDATGNQDYMAILVTKKEIDFDALNKKVSGSTGGNYLEKFKQALGSSLAKRVQFKAENGEMHFLAEDTDEDAAVVIVVEINKK